MVYYLRYCKYVLNVSEITTSSWSTANLGRYPLIIECTSKGILLCARIMSGPGSKVLSVKMYDLSYKLYYLGIYNSFWLSFVKFTFCFCWIWIWLARLKYAPYT